MTSILAAEGGYQFFELKGGEFAILALSAGSALLALAVGFVLMRDVLAQDQGTPKMIEIATAIQEGAAAYLKRQFRTIGVVLVPLAAVVFLTSTEELHHASGNPLTTSIGVLSGELHQLPVSFALRGIERKKNFFLRHPIVPLLSL